MQEKEWLTCQEPARMLEVLRKASLDGWGRPSFPIVSDRKLRLFACACVRRWPGKQTRELPYMSRLEGMIDAGATEAEYVALDPLLRRMGTDWASHQLGRLPGYGAEMANLCREIIGNPYRPVTLPKGRKVCYWCKGKKKLPDSGPNGYGPNTWEKCDVCKGQGYLGGECPWLTWNDGTIKRMAQQIYDDRDFGAMPILSDVLEEAGCQDVELLTHGRSGGPHVRGCFLLDLILGKS